MISLSAAGHIFFTLSVNMHLLVSVVWSLLGSMMCLIYMYMYVRCACCFVIYLVECGIILLLRKLSMYTASN